MSPKTMPPIRVNFDISGTLKRDLDKLRIDSSESRSDVIRRAIRVLHRLSTWTSTGGQIVLESADGADRRVLEIL